MNASNIISKVIGVFNKVPSIKQNKGTTIYDNTFQAELLKACLDSGTARVCIERRASYIYGTGFINELVAQQQANAKQTFNKLLGSISPNVGLYKTVCLKVLVDSTGNPYRVYPLAVDKVQKGDVKFIYNPTKNTDYFDRNKDVEYLEFDPTLTNEQRKKQLAQEIKEHGKQRGTILYHFNESIGQSVYCVPPAYSGLEDIKSDHELSSYELENLENGFLPSAMLTIVGNVDDTVKDANNKTEKDIVKERLSEFTAKKEGRARLLVMTAETKEGIPNLQQLDTGKILDGLEKITDRVGRKVCRLFEIPPVLAGFEDASILGSNQTFKNALVTLQHSVQKDKDLIIEALNMVFPDLDFAIGELKLIDYIPAEVLAKLTDDELRALAGYEPLPNTDTGNGVSLAQVLGVGGTQALQGILVDTILTQDQKVSILEILFNITNDNAKKMVYGNQAGI